MKLKLLFVLFVVQLSFAQQRTCGSDEFMQGMMADPAMQAQYQDFQRQFEVELQRLSSQNKSNQSENSVNATIRIPVAVHYPSTLNTSTETVKSCLRALAQKQVLILNADYNATNVDLSIWTNSAAMSYPGVNYGVMDVSWEIATQNHPSGSGLSDGTLAVTFGTHFLSGANSDPAWAGYCNLVVRNITNPPNALGYSPIGGLPSSGMTVVIDNNAFGAAMSPAPTSCSGYVPNSNYNLGRTLTHELGHFFNLYHTFQGCDISNCAGNGGDMVCDTPQTNTSVGTCTPVGSVTSGCGETQLTMNYMDYPPDACMYMFTAGQATRMTAWYNTISSQLATNVLGTNELIATNFSIAPNPNDGTFAIQLKEQNDKFSVLIIDALGRIVYDNEFNQTVDLVQTIQLDKVLTGIYFVTIESNGETLTKKIVIE
jgi:Pregnancy-associated plasma protein-A/Secretion system C-terminal sorting domain